MGISQPRLYISISSRSFEIDVTLWGHNYQPSAHTNVSYVALRRRLPRTEMMMGGAWSELFMLDTLSSVWSVTRCTIGIILEACLSANPIGCLQSTQVQVCRLQSAVSVNCLETRSQSSIIARLRPAKRRGEPRCGGSGLKIYSLYLQCIYTVDNLPTFSFRE